MLLLLSLSRRAVRGGQTVEPAARARSLALKHVTSSSLVITPPSHDGTVYYMLLRFPGTRLLKMSFAYTKSRRSCLSFVRALTKSIAFRRIIWWRQSRRRMTRSPLMMPQRRCHHFFLLSSEQSSPFSNYCLIHMGMNMQPVCTCTPCPLWWGFPPIPSSIEYVANTDGRKSPKKGRL